MLEELGKFFVVLLLVVEPLLLLPVLAGLTEGADEARRRRTAWTAVRLSAVVGLVFTAALASRFVMDGIRGAMSG